MENKPITCPNCKSENTISTVTYRKAPIIRIVKFICIVAFFIILANNLHEFIEYSNPTAFAQEATTMSSTITIVVQPKINKTIIIANIFAIAGILFGVIQYCIERKACILHLCKNCDHTWQDTNTEKIEKYN